MTVNVKGVSFSFLFKLFCLGIHCCTQASSSCYKRGYSPFGGNGLLTAVASLVAEHGLEGVGFSSCGPQA